MVMMRRSQEKIKLETVKSAWCCWAYNSIMQQSLLVKTQSQTEISTIRSICCLKSPLCGRTGEA